MENQCRHNSFRQVSKIIPRSLQTPAALKEEQYKRFFKHKIFKHSPGVLSTSDTETPSTHWLLAPHTHPLLSLEAQPLTCWILSPHPHPQQGRPYRVPGIANRDRRTKRIYCGPNRTSLSSLSIRLIRVYAIYWSRRWNSSPHTPHSVRRLAFKAFHSQSHRSPFASTRRLNSGSLSWPLWNLWSVIPLLPALVKQISGYVLERDLGGSL